MDGQTLEKFCNALIQDEILPILQSNYAALYEQAGEHGSAFFEQGGALASFKDDGKGLVSKGEIEAERHIREKFSSAFPDIAIYGEELGDDAEESEYTLVIDPVDGTSAMIESASAYNPALGFGITLGFLKNREFWGGIIYELRPDENGHLSLEQIWSSWDERLKTPVDKPFESLISTAPEVMFTSVNERCAFHALEKSATQVITGRNCIGFMDLLEQPGSCAVEADLSIHDAAAIIPILKNAGLAVTDHAGEGIVFENVGQEFKILAATPQCHAGALEIYQAALKEKPLDIPDSSVLNASQSLNRTKFNDE